MRSKKIFSFDEQKDAEQIYNNGFENGIDYSKMYIIAKYIRQTFDFGEIRLEKELIRFCKREDRNFNPVKEAPMIRKWINSAMKYDLRKIDSVSITDKELSFLRTIKNNKDRRILYCMLVFSKALKKGNIKRKKDNATPSVYYYIHYNNFPDIIRMSKLSNIGETDLGDILNQYKNNFTFYSADRELIRLDFATKDDGSGFIIKDLENAIDYFNILFQNSKPAAVCVICGKEIKKNSNIQKYCKSCAKIRSREQHKEIMRKRRSVTK